MDVIQRSEDVLSEKSLGCRSMLFKSKQRVCPHAISMGVVSALLVVLVAGCTGIRLPDPRVRYVAFGDSATAGTEPSNYPAILRELLDEPPDTFANEGKGGETSGEGLVRLRSLLATDVFPNAEVIFYWEGGNDIAEFLRTFDPLVLFAPDDPEYPFVEALSLSLAKTQSNLSLAVDAAQKAGLQVFMATYYLLREDLRACDALALDIILPGQAQRVNIYLGRLNERIRTVAAESGAVLVGVAAEDEAIRASRDNYSDCNHLTEAGNAIVAGLFSDAMATADVRAPD